MQVQLLITGDFNTGVISVQGTAMEDPRLYQWLLAETRRVLERITNEKEAAAKNGKPHLILAREMPPGPPTGA